LLLETVQPEAASVARLLKVADRGLIQCLILFKDAFMAATNIKDCFNIQPVY
jgi:hypothetical protein